MAERLAAARRFAVMRHQHPLLFWILGLSVVMVGLIGARRMGERLGWMGYVAGFILPCLVVLAAFLALFVLVHFAEYLRRAGPRYPPCHTGRCKGRRWPSLHDRDQGDYERLWVGDDSVLRCRCGRDYVTREAGRRFLERLPDGTLKPYMVHKPFRGWFPDTDGDE